MANNPLRLGRRKPYAVPRPPKPVLVKIEKPALWKKIYGIIKNNVKHHPHLFLVSGTFIFLFAIDFINLITFISLGFFSLLFSDHMVDTARGFYRKRRDNKLAKEQEKLAVPAHENQRGYFQRLAKKQKDRT